MGNLSNVPPGAGGKHGSFGRIIQVATEVSLTVLLWLGACPCAPRDYLLSLLQSMGWIVHLSRLHWPLAKYNTEIKAT